MCSNQDGDLLLSSNSDLFDGGEAEEVILEPCMAMTGGVEGIVGYVQLGKDAEERVIIGFDTQAGPSVLDVGFDVSGAKVVGRDGLVIVGAGGKETNAGVESEIRVLFGQDGEDFAVPVRSIPLLVGKRSEAVGADLLIGVKEQGRLVESVSARRSEVKLSVPDGAGGGYRQVLKTTPIKV